MNRLFFYLIVCSATVFSSCGGDGEYVEEGPDDVATGAFTCSISGDFTQSFSGNDDTYGLYGSSLNFGGIHDDTDISIEIGEYAGPGNYTWTSLPQNPNRLFVDKDGSRYVGYSGSITITSDEEGVISGSFSSLKASVQSFDEKRIELTNGSFTLNPIE